MALILLPATNRSFDTHYYKYWSAPATNRSMYTLCVYATYPVSLTGVDLTMGTTRFPSGTYLFSLRVTTADSAKGSCSITFPWSETTSGGQPIGLSRQIASNSYSYIQVTVTAIYPNTFKGWYSASTGGTLLTTTATVNVFYNNGYDDWYAQWN